MNEQTTFVEPLKRAKRVRTKPQKLAEKFKTLAEWYAANKPDVRVLRISRDDAWSLRESWIKDETECRMAGFRLQMERARTRPGSISDEIPSAIEVKSMSYRGFDLVEAG